MHWSIVEFNKTTGYHQIIARVAVNLLYSHADWASKSASYLEEGVCYRKISKRSTQALIHCPTRANRRNSLKMRRQKNLKTPTFHPSTTKLKWTKSPAVKVCVNESTHTSAATTGFKPEVAIIKWPQGQKASAIFENSIFQGSRKACSCEEFQELILTSR